MEVFVELERDCHLPTHRRLVLAVSNTSLATTSSEWHARRWNRLLQKEHLANSFGAHYLVLSTAHVHEHHRAIRIKWVDMFAHLQPIAAKCTNKTPDGLYCTARPILLKTRDGIEVYVDVRMTKEMCSALSKLVLDPNLEVNDPLKTDHVQLSYVIGINKKQSYARWAAASYGELHHNEAAKVAIRRFCRQTELAGLLFGCNLENADLSIQDTCRLAAELCTMPLRAHGVYVQDGKRDMPTMPFFGEKDGTLMAAFDCEDAAMFVVSELMHIWTLMQPMGRDDRKLLEDVKKSGCNAGSAKQIAEVLRLVSHYIPLHLVLSQKTSKNGAESEELHVALLLVVPRQLKYLFGEDWRLAVPASRRGFIEEKTALPPYYVDACTLLGDKAMSGFHHTAKSHDKRFHNALDDSVYGTLEVVGIFGANIACDTEYFKSVKLGLKLFSLMDTLKACSTASSAVPEHPSWRTFQYPGPGAVTMLPGPDLPVDQLSDEPVPVSRETPEQKDFVVITRDTRSKRTFDLRLFANLPCAGMICEEQ